MNNIYAENFKTQMKETEEDLKRNKEIYSCIGRQNIVKMSILP